MRSFEFSRAASLADAIGQVGPGVVPIAGGTNLVDLMRSGVAHPAKLVAIDRLPLAAIEETPEGGLRLGALATNAATAYDPLVQARYPLLTESILAGASAQLRNVATNGGNLNQRTRCPWFYDPAAACNKREPGAGCDARGGDARMQAILGTSPACIAPFPSDMCAALAALDARVRLEGPDGGRTVALVDYHRLPDEDPSVDNDLRPGELVTAIDLPARGFPRHYRYLKVRDRRSYAFAIVAAAVGLTLEDGVIRDIRVALGSVSAKPWRIPAAEALVIGRAPKPTEFLRLADALLDGAVAHDGNAYKIDLARRTVVQACMDAVRRPEHAAPTDRPAPH